MTRTWPIIVSLSCAFTSVAQGELKGEPEHLTAAIDAYRANLDRLVTWRGTVKITDACAETDDTRRYNVSFFCERPRGLLRWNWAPVPPSQERVVDGLVREGRWHVLPQGTIREANGNEHANLAIRPLKQAGGMQRTSYYFDPLWYITKGWGSDIASRFAFVRENAAHPKNEWSVSREDQTVTLEHSGQVLNRYVVDLEQGGNIVRADFAEPGQSSRFELSWQQVSGVWIPRKYFYKYPVNENGRVIYRTREMEWQENVINQAIAEQTFLKDSLPLRPGDRVTDQQTGESYTVQ